MGCGGTGCICLPRSILLIQSQSIHSYYTLCFRRIAPRVYITRPIWPFVKIQCPFSFHLSYGLVKWNLDSPHTQAEPTTTNFFHCDASNPSTPSNSGAEPLRSIGGSVLEHGARFNRTIPGRLGQPLSPDSFTKSHSKNTVYCRISCRIFGIINPRRII